ncbi:MAG TPA: hypothetical protein VGF97_13390 [Rhizomicrobium sp.]|jgi:hypothetical protein
MRHGKRCGVEHRLAGVFRHPGLSLPGETRTKGFDVLRDQLRYIVARLSADACKARLDGGPAVHRSRKAATRRYVNNRAAKSLNAIHATGQAPLERFQHQNFGLVSSQEALEARDQFGVSSRLGGRDAPIDRG